jgi:Uma2 family endonuclease
MAAHTSFVPVEVYLASSYEPDAEYVDGLIEMRPMGQYDHSSWQHALEVWFASHAKEWGIRVRPELRIKAPSGNFRVSDVTVLDRNLPIQQIITHPPIGVFEILSPEDSVMRLITKLREYEQMGIGSIVVIDPGGEHLRFIDGRLEPLPAGPFTLAGSVCRFDLAGIEKLLD